MSIGQTLNRNKFELEVNSLIGRFIQASQQQFAVTVQLIQDTTYGNQLLNRLFLNVLLTDWLILSISSSEGKQNMTLGISNNILSDCS